NTAQASRQIRKTPPISPPTMKLTDPIPTVPAMSYLRGTSQRNILRYQKESRIISTAAPLIDGSLSGFLFFPFRSPLCLRRRLTMYAVMNLDCRCSVSPFRLELFLQLLQSCS